MQKHPILFQYHGENMLITVNKKMLQTCLSYISHKTCSIFLYVGGVKHPVM